MRTPWLLIAWTVLCLGGCGPLTFTVGVGSGHQKLDETTVETEPGHHGAKVAIIDVSGVLINGEKAGLIQPGENPVSLLAEKLHRAAGDHNVKAVVLRLNTPGGGVTASDVMYRQVLRFKQQTHKPVVAMAMDVTASGGYYLACAADHIVAQPTSVVGSIGVIVQTISIKPALSRFGVEAESITSGPNKAAGSPLETMTPGHRAVLRSLVDDFYHRFVGVVQTGRPGIPEDRFAELTDGRVISGERAAAVGLVDQLGDLYTAFDQAKSLAGIQRARLVLYHRPLRYVGSPYAAAPPIGGTQINLAQVNLAGGAPMMNPPVGFYYLWTAQ